MVGKSHFLNHEHLIQLHGNWEDQQAIYIIEEYAYGGDLLQDHMTHPERYSEAFVVKTVVLPLLKVLCHMHDNRIVHRTLCPEHLMLGRKRVLKVGHLIDVAHMGVEDLVDRAGLLDYMPPEMLALQEPSGSWDSSASQTASMEMAGPRGAATILKANAWELQQDYNEKVDVWQVGCVIHELLCGTPPFSTDDKQLSAALILWADVHQWPDHISPECISFMQDCLIKDPENRPSCEDLLDHAWITKSVKGEVLLSVRQLQEAQNALSQSTLEGNADSGWRGWMSSAWAGLSSIFTERPLDSSSNDNEHKI
jgi:serine/threonine protein kinase